MLSQPYKELAPPPRYLAQAPWIGPLLGGASAGMIGVGAATDPLLGEAFLALFLPVKRARGTFTRQAQSGWAARVPAAGGERYRFEVPLAWWQGAVAGILMLLVYDRSSTLKTFDGGRKVRRDFPETWEDQLAYFNAAIKADAIMPIGDLPEDMRREIETRVGEFLQQPATAVAPALIELGVPPAGDLTFAVASCQYPAGFLDRDVAQRSYERLQARVAGAAADRPQCLLLLGDQVYIDATAGLFDPSTLSDKYDLPYERLLRMPPLRQVLRRIPVYTMLDDHEIEDNWEPCSGSPESLERGRAYYVNYQRLAGPPPQAGRLWYDFEVNGIPFFMADTRTERDARRVDNFAAAHIMSPDQLEALKQWLSDPRWRDLPKFIASPASLLPRHRKATHDGQRAGGLRSDGWDGYPASLSAVMTHIAENRIRNVVFLSGDEHISFATTAVLRGDDGREITRLHSIHSSGLYSPFAFANSTRDALLQPETMRCGAHRCEVSVQFAPPGDGFALLRCWEENGRWRMRCLFDREPPAPEAWIDLA
jgi:hypothetical protein